MWRCGLTSIVVVKVLFAHFIAISRIAGSHCALSIDTGKLGYINECKSRIYEYILNRSYVCFTCTVSCDVVHRLMPMKINLLAIPPTPVTPAISCKEGFAYMMHCVVFTVM